MDNSDYTKQLEERIVVLENTLQPFIAIWEDYMELYAMLPDNITFEEYAARRFNWYNIASHFRSAWAAQSKREGAES